jgi:hypothetical protein
MRFDRDRAAAHRLSAHHAAPAMQVTDAIAQVVGRRDDLHGHHRFEHL